VALQVSFEHGGLAEGGMSCEDECWASETHVPELAFQFTVLVLFERFHSGVLLCAIDVACGTVASVSTNVGNE
jgi:hypothetical protein